ncbi:MAG: type II toxin-antitoxin system RelE/ParE family toxin [Candidatus Omnitrophota bacterium]
MNRYIIVIAPRAKKQIDNLPEHVKQRIATVLLDVISINPFSGKALKGELSGLYSYRVGDYRVIYTVVKYRLIIQVIKVMHRREAYR